MDSIVNQDKLLGYITYSTYKMVDDIPYELVHKPVLNANGEVEIKITVKHGLIIDGKITYMELSHQPKELVP
jgi:hypothetical protein